MKKQITTCPKCQGNNIVYLAAKKPPIITLIIAILFTAAIAGATVYLYYEKILEVIQISFAVVVVAVAVMFIMTNIVIAAGCKTHTKCICRNCGHKWYTD